MHTDAHDAFDPDDIEGEHFSSDSESSSDGSGDEGSMHGSMRSMVGDNAVRRRNSFTSLHHFTGAEGEGGGSIRGLGSRKNSRDSLDGSVFDDDEGTGFDFELQDAQDALDLERRVRHTSTHNRRNSWQQGMVISFDDFVSPPQPAAGARSNLGGKMNKSMDNVQAAAAAPAAAASSAKDLATQGSMVGILEHTSTHNRRKSWQQGKVISFGDVLSPPQPGGARPSLGGMNRSMENVHSASSSAKELATQGLMVGILEGDEEERRGAGEEEEQKEGGDKGGRRGGKEEHAPVGGEEEAETRI